MRPYARDLPDANRVRLTYIIAISSRRTRCFTSLWYVWTWSFHASSKFASASVIVLVAWTEIRFSSVACLLRTPPRGTRRSRWVQYVRTDWRWGGEQEDVPRIIVFGLHRAGGSQRARKEWVIAEMAHTRVGMTYSKPSTPSKWVMKSHCHLHPTRAWRNLWGTA